MGDTRQSLGFPHKPFTMRALGLWVDDLARQTLWVAKTILVIGLVTAVYYAADREPPFAVTTIYPAAAAPGDYITLRAGVWRDHSRHCSAHFSRYIFDSDNSRVDLGSSYASEATLDALEAMTPGMMAMRFRLPPLMASGPAVLYTDLQFICNKMHRLWPIEVTTRIPFTVLPL